MPHNLRCHLAFTTLHAPVAAGAVQSMLAVDVAPYCLISSLLGVVAQRLVRQLCLRCQIIHDISDVPQAFEGIQALLEENREHVFYGPGSCHKCDGSGYRERRGIFEIMIVTRDIS